MNTKDLVEKNTQLRNSYFEIIGNGPENILYIKNFISKNDLKIFMDYINNLSDSDEEFYGPLDLRIERIEKENSKLAILIKLYENKTFQYITEHFIKKLNIPIQREASNYCHFVKWLPGMLSKLHADCEKPDGSPALYAGFNRLNIATLVYINDDYVGGKISFPDQDFTIKPSAGDLIIFPGNNAYKHEVTTVESGKRYTMPSWYSFDINDVMIGSADETKNGLLTNSKQLWDNNAGRVEL